MNESFLVNFHCHSIFSDGEQTPENLAANLAMAGVRYAALTDHDSVEGLPRFRDAVKKRGIAFVPGVELTTYFNGREAHLLGYGFDPEFPELIATLLSLRQVKELEIQSIAGSLRKIGVNRSEGMDGLSSTSIAHGGRLGTTEAIDLLHRAGGKVFWAHPLQYEPDPDILETHVAELKARGLDGLEAVYAPYSEPQRDLLRRLAQKYDLAVSAGTDYHSPNGPGSPFFGIEMAQQDWAGFRQVLFASVNFNENAGRRNGQSRASGSGLNLPVTRPHHFRLRSFALRIFLPTLIAIVLFLSAIWGIILPSFEQTLIDRKRELIRELTNSAWSILASYESDERNGLMEREEAQTMAIARIAALRYGPEGKDYFWIQDLQPSMVMHPYRPDLNGQELTNFADPRGVRIFVEFADLVRRDGEGYIDYVWQWKDDPQRLEPKESFVKGFEPWGWVIGTGIYTDDVNREIARIERSLINTSLAISGAVVLLLLFVLVQSMRIERERQDVVDSLRESTERYHSLVEATTEGTVLIVDGRCRYANPTFLNMTGYTPEQLEFLGLDDLLPHEVENQTIWKYFETPAVELVMDGKPFEGVLRHADDHYLECVLAMSPILFAGQRGFILLARDIARRSQVAPGEGVSHAAQSAPVGVFRARAVRRATFLEMNTAARSLIGKLESQQPGLADLFSDPSEFDGFVRALQEDGKVDEYIIHQETRDATARLLCVSVRLVHDDRNQPAYMDGVLFDVTNARKQEAVREALIEKLQASLLFLHQPIASVGREVVICSLDTSIEQLASMMTARNVTAGLVSTTEGTVIGIVTDHDLRERVLSGRVSPATPVHAVMSSPLTKISEKALIYEALMRMEEKGVRHLAVEDRDGQIVGVVDNKALIQFQRYGPIVLTREISRSATPEDVARHCQRTPPLVKTLLESSARPRHVTTMLASICDAATERLILLAIDELGPPPADFAFIGMGSQGRQEQTLLTDQDNGIIFASPSGGDPARISEYFHRLGTRVCDGLHRAGYPYCRGNVMAGNPRWCRSLSDWVSGFEEWVQKSEPQEIMDLSIFFDFRTVYGDADLTNGLRRYIHTSLENLPALYHHLAQNALMFKPPFRLIGNIYLGGGATEHAGEINLKDALMPIVSFARLYALRHQVAQTHTLERIEALSERGILLPSSRDEIATAYDYLMGLRLQNQSLAIESGRQPNNIIQPGKLGYLQREMLKQAFTQIAAVQKKISYDFLGGG